MTRKKTNQEINEEHYDKLYANYDIKNILYWIKNLEPFLDTALTTETSWYSLYQQRLKERLKDKLVLEMGCGDCVNTAVMAALGAKVYANDIAASSGKIIDKLNQNYKFDTPIKFIEGDFLKNDLPSETFDFVIGKAFLHHLTIPEERLFLEQTSRLLKPAGEARFFEPAVNSKILDELRWYIPLADRPSKFNKQAFRIWKENDPHPDRSFSSDHFRKVGYDFFSEVEIIPVGAIERFSRFMKWGASKNSFKRWALSKEKYLPDYINFAIARAQLIIYKNNGF